MEQNERKQVIFSGIQPSGAMTIGNYIGALRNWAKLQDEYDCYYCVVDLHAITVEQVPAELRAHTLEAAAMIQAIGIDPAKSTLFVQSHVPCHAELAWVLDCMTYYGEAKRMTQFKDKSQRHPENVNVGLFAYPVLMAADILLYQANLVPIGNDQKQHLELARDLAQRFNSKYSPTFAVPEGYIPKASEGARIMSLADPTKKMSKSDPAGAILLTDTPDQIIAKLKRAVTDSDAAVAYDPQTKPGVSNLLTIYSVFAGGTPETAAHEFAGQGYGALKSAVADAVIAGLEPIRAEYKRILADKTYLNGVLHDGAAKAYRTARKTLAKVYRKVGFVDLEK